MGWGTAVDHKYQALLTFQCNLGHQPGGSLFQNYPLNRPPDNCRYIDWNFFFYFLTKSIVVGSQKNHLNEMVLLSTQNTCFNNTKHHELP